MYQIDLVTLVRGGDPLAAAGYSALPLASRRGVDRVPVGGDEAGAQRPPADPGLAVHGGRCDGDLATRSGTRPALARPRNQTPSTDCHGWTCDTSAFCTLHFIKRKLLSPLSGCRREFGSVGRLYWEIPRLRGVPLSGVLLPARELILDRAKALRIDGVAPTRLPTRTASYGDGPSPLGRPSPFWSLCDRPSRTAVSCRTALPNDG